MTFSSDRIRRILLSVLLLLVLLSAFAASWRTTSDSDMGWHLATGRFIVQHHQIPGTDLLSYTSQGRTWIYPPFAGVLLYLIFSAIGYAGLSWFCALACVATFAYLVRRRNLAAALLALCAVTPVAFRMVPRADLFTPVFFALLLGELWAFHNGERARLWLLPVVMLFWVNFHPGFVAGLGIIVAYLLIEAGDLLFADRRQDSLCRLRKSAPWLAASAVATVFNPWGPRLYAASVDLAGWHGSTPGTFSTSSYIGEFLSVPLSSHLLDQLIDLRHPENGFVCLLVGALAVVALSLWKKRFGVAVIQAAALYLAFQHARYIGLFCISTVIFGSTLLPAQFRRKESKHSTAPGGALYLIGTAVMVVASIIAIVRIDDFVSNRTYVVFHAESRFGAGEANWFPEKAARFIEQQRLPGNIFEEFALGGFASWRLGPQYPDFIDGRADHLNPPLLVAEHELLSHDLDSRVWTDAADRWGINVLLISEGGTRAMDRQDALRYCNAKSWRPVYMDEVSLVFLRVTPANQPLIDRLQIDCATQPLIPPAQAGRKDLYDFHMQAGALFFALHRDQEAEEQLLKAASLYPQDPNAQLWLAELYARGGLFDKAEAAFHSSLARNETDKTWYELGRFYAQAGHLPQADQAFNRAAQLAVTPFIPYIARGEVDLALNRPQAALQAFNAAEMNSPYRGAENLAPDLYAQIAAGRARAQFLLGHPAEAIRLQQEAVRLAPNSALRWNQLADLLAASGQLDASVQARQRARDLSAHSSDSN